jgi:hypothetical protein
MSDAEIGLADLDVCPFCGRDVYFTAYDAHLDRCDPDRVADAPIKCGVKEMTR